MEENKSSVIKSAMSYGLLLGIFWLFKYVFFILGYTISSNYLLFYQALAPVTLILAYIFTRRYRMDIGGRIQFFHAWQFGILLYTFAGIILSLEQFIFYRFLAPSDFIANSLQATLEMLEGTNLSPKMAETITRMEVPTPISMAIMGILNNTFYGIIFSIPVAALLCRNNATGQIDENNHLENE
ncbi:MAG: DUF4199 domain-containing protein [Tannerellaceae bacterium]|nr:DUF4199 domain-containing protein [Tannerellaceae bacterium]